MTLNYCNRPVCAIVGNDGNLITMLLEIVLGRLILSDTHGAEAGMEKARDIWSSSLFETSKMTLDY